MELKQTNQGKSYSELPSPVSMKATVTDIILSGLEKKSYEINDLCDRVKGKLVSLHFFVEPENPSPSLTKEPSCFSDYVQIHFDRLDRGIDKLSAINRHLDEII